MDASGPIPSSCLPDIHVSEFHLVEAEIGFLAGTPTTNRLEIAKQASEFLAAHTVLHIVLLLPSGGPSENARWTLPGIHPRMLAG